MKIVFRTLNMIGLTCLLLGILLVGVSIITGGSLEGVLNQVGVSEYVERATQTADMISEEVRNFIDYSVNQLFSGNVE